MRYAIVILLFFLHVGCASGTSGWQDEGGEAISMSAGEISVARINAEVMMQVRLRAPSTAKFNPKPIVTCMYFPKKDVTLLSVFSWVDAVNAYNAPLRQSFVYSVALKGRQTAEALVRPSSIHGNESLSLLN